MDEDKRKMPTCENIKVEECTSLNPTVQIRLLKLPVWRVVTFVFVSGSDSNLSPFLTFI